MIENFNYKVPKTQDCILINVNNWVQTSEISICKINGKTSNTYISEVLATHFHSETYQDCPIQKGDYVLITKVASEIATMRNFDIGDGNKYFNVPISQVLGIFKEKTLDFNHLELLYDKVLIEPYNKPQSLLELNSNETLGKIIKLGSTGLDKNLNKVPFKVKEGDLVIVKDNVTTPIRLNERTYSVIEERNIVGVINYGFSINDINFINESILMKPYYAPTVLNSNVLITPDINYEDLDYSDIYNRNLFEIIFLDKDIQDLKAGDKVIVKREFTNYVYLNQEKYFLLNGKDWVEAKIQVGEEKR